MLKVACSVLASDLTGLSQAYYSYQGRFPFPRPPVLAVATIEKVSLAPPCLGSTSPSHFFCRDQAGAIVGQLNEEGRLEELGTVVVDELRTLSKHFK